MKKLFTFVLLLAMATMISQSYAQDLKKLIKKRETTEETTESEQEENNGKVINSVNNGIDKFQEKFLGNKKKNTETEEETTTEAETETTETEEATNDNDVSDYRTSDKVAQKSMMKMLGLTGNVTTKEKYDFDGSMKMIIKTYDKKGSLDESTDYYTYLSESTPDYAMVFTATGSKEKTTIIFDTENRAMITLGEDNGDKTGFVIGVSEEQVESFKENAEEEKSSSDETVSEMPDTYTKTGRSKKILGYNCDEYRYDDETGTVELWITQELNGKMNKSYMQNSAFAGFFTYAYASNGTVLEYIYYDKENGEKTTMTVDELNLDKKHSISTIGYNIISMGDTGKEK